MTEAKRKLYLDNADIIDWMASQLSDKDFDCDMLMPAVEKSYTDAVMKFEKDESEFEQFAVAYIKLSISKFKISNGEKMLLSSVEIETMMAEEKNEEEDDYLRA